MSSHDPNNANCDKVLYKGADGVLCTCDFDSPDDAPQPSTVMRTGADGVMRPGPAYESTTPLITLTGGHAVAYVELQAATRELEAARAMLKPAEARWRAALDRFHEEMLRL